MFLILLFAFLVSTNMQVCRSMGPSSRSVKRLKAAVHYSVGQICEEMGEEEGVTFQRQFIAVLAEATFKHLSTMALDLELFAKHAKRTTINADDVKLLVRKSPPLLEHISSLCEQQSLAATEKRGRKGGGPGRKKKSATTSVDTAADNEDSNL